MTATASPTPVVALTDGYHVYERIKRGVYHQLGRTGERLGITCTGFTPRPHWEPARVCEYDCRVDGDGLTCRNCGTYDTNYALTGLRSFCRNQGKGTP